MNPNIPLGAAHLLEFIYNTDAGHPIPACYTTIFGNRQGHLPKPLTSMTLNEVIAAQKNWSSKAWIQNNWKISGAASSAAGAAQFMRATNIDLMDEMKLSGRELYSADLQDRMAYQLLKRRGYAQFVAGKIDGIEFAKRLAMEWASLPVLANMQGAHRKLTRGQSYYAGDALNKSLTSPEKLETVLALVRKAPDSRTAPPPAPVEAPKPVPAPVEPPKAQPSPAPAPEASSKHVGIFGALVLLVHGHVDFGRTVFGP